VAYVGRRYHDEGASYHQLAQEMAARVGAKVTANALKGLILREFPERRGSRRDANRQEARLRNVQIRQAIANGAPYQKVSGKFGLSGSYVRAIAPAAGSMRLSYRERTRLLHRAGIMTGPPLTGAYKIDLSLEGKVIAEGYTFEEIGIGQCRFSIGKNEGGGYRFCGAAVMDRGSNSARGSYCEHHYQVCHEMPKPAGDSLPLPANDNNVLPLSEAA
jgi:hypothetical protein